MKTYEFYYDEHNNLRLKDFYLHRMDRHSGGVCWIGHNSYIMTINPKEKMYHFYSVNGIGEIRWEVMTHDKEFECLVDFFHPMDVIREKRKEMNLI